MKKIVCVLFFFFAIQVCIVAKTTYVPTYYTQINVEGNGFVYSDSTCRRELTMRADDGRYIITVLHDSVTAERVKAIKNMKAAAGWATAASVLYGVSAQLNPMHTSWDAVNYISDMDSKASAAMLHVAAAEGAVSLQRVQVSIIVENTSEREMMVNDMTRGLTWYVPAHNYIQLSVGNPEVNKLRIAYADCEDLKKDYVTIQAANFLEKSTISYEDDSFWYFPVYKTDQYDSQYGHVQGVLDHYEKVNKVTFEHQQLTIEGYKAFKKVLKAEEKLNN